MCATPQRRRRNSMGSGSNAGNNSSNSAAPTASDTVADTAAENELRRLRSLYGRRATILTPERAALGQAPTAKNNLLGA